MKQSFQDGVNTIYNKILSLGVTPSGNSPTDIVNAMQSFSDKQWADAVNSVISNPNPHGLYNQSQYDQNYTNGYNAGYSAGQASGKNYYRLRFTNTDVNTDRSTAEGWIYESARVVFNFSSSNTGHYNNGIIGIYDESNGNSQVYYRENAGTLNGVSLGLDRSHTYRVYIRTSGGYGYNCTFDGTCYYS